MKASRRKTKSRAKTSPLIREFKDPEDGEEYRYAYADQHLNTTIALQIKAIREQRGLKQAELAEAIGTQQPGIARLENVNYSGWKAETLQKLARALGVRLKITFETFGTLLDEDAEFSREALERPKFEDDPVFSGKSSATEIEPSAPADIKYLKDYVKPKGNKKNDAAEALIKSLAKPETKKDGTLGR